MTPGNKINQDGIINGFILFTSIILQELKIEKSDLKRASDLKFSKPDWLCSLDVFVFFWSVWYQFYSFNLLFFMASDILLLLVKAIILVAYWIFFCHRQQNKIGQCKENTINI